MKRRLLITAVLFLSASLFMVHFAQTTTEAPSKKAAKKWFNKKEWLQGVALTPHESIDKQEFARQYQLNKTYWDAAFNFLKTHDLAKLEKGKYPVDGDNVFVSVTEDPTKDLEKTNWESHRKYIDIQCIITGDEKMGVCPIGAATVTKPYDEKRDVANYSAEGKMYVGKAGTFFIFFPNDAHRPNITPGGNLVVKKVVIKVRVAA